MNFSQLSFGFFSFKLYGVFVALAFVIASWNFYKALQKKNLSIDFFLHHFWRWVIGAIVIGRFFPLALNWDIFDRGGLYSFFTFWDGGIDFFGAFFGFILIMWLDMKKHGKYSFAWMDLGVLPLLIGIMILDLGGFITGAVYGSETVMPWGIQYETISVDILSPVHPVTLYAFLLHLWLYWWAQKSTKTFEKFSGKLAIRVGLILFLFDFFLQFFRGDMGNQLLGFIRIEQIFDILVIGFLYWWGHKKIIKS